MPRHERGEADEGYLTLLPMARLLLSRVPLLQRILLLGVLSASCSCYFLVLHAQASVPPLYDGFAYGDAATTAWTDSILVKAFLDLLCPNSRDAWQPLRLAVDRYAPCVSLIIHPFPLLELAEMMTDVYGNVSGEPPLDEPIIDVSSEQFYGEGYDDSDKRIPDMTIINKQLGWNPKTPLKDLLETTLTYQHKTYIEAIKRQMAQAED
ncbi:hypothetical protein GUJ93_ZPchr0010g10589 [Zizania palustris]|uniref:Thioredoxin-like fold domain-containing protein n=1 Tax=Zizania palustris TaxID=103762 RepID=A0A8J5W736_ZIZPA|nr:hypothetical protein GUJ93_ZPchr0010g10589 [Zizania palustris]